MKQFRKRKLNNKGLSLVEILVTVVIVALISAPIVDSFMHAIRVNSEARLIQNGTAVAQDTAELFEVFSVDALVDKYDGKEENGVYTFTNISMTGADGEEFEVDVKLDPTAYKLGLDAENKKKIEVNEQELPVFSALYGSDSIMLYRQYVGPDESLKTLFASKITDTDILDNIYEDEHKKLITKATTIDISCTQDATNPRKFTYVVTVTIIYTYDGANEVKAEKVLMKTYDADQIHTIYLLCPIFDRFYKDANGADGTKFYTSDVININYVYDGNLNDQQELYFYLAEQKIKNKDDSTKWQCISPEKVQISVGTKDGSKLIDTNYVNYAEKNNLDDTVKFKVYSNVGDGFLDFENPCGLTYGNYNTGISLYEMEVTVRLKGDDDVVTTFNTAK